MLRPLRRGVAALCFTVAPLALTAVPTVAVAQDGPELQKARQLFRQGLSLEAAGNWSGALQKFEEVARVKLTPQVRYHMGRCKEHLGRLNEALGEYRIAEFEATEQGAKELGEISAAREQLEARVPKLVISRGAGVETASVILDGVEIGEARVGKEVSVDPGPHVVGAKFRDGRQFQMDVSVAEGETKSIELVPPANLSAGPVAADDDEPDEPAAPPKTDASARIDEKSSAVPWIVGGIGVASLAASGVFFVLRNGAESDLDDTCRGGVCPKSLEGTQSDGETYAMLTGVTLGVGVVGLGVATVLLLTGGESDDAAKEGRAGIRLGVAAAPGLGGVSVAGGF